MALRIKSRWHDDDAQRSLEEIASDFGLHPLAISDVVHVPQRPKADVYDDYLFVVTRMAAPGAEDWSSMVAAAVTGDREAANASAARIDARPGGPFMLAIGSEMCFCGAPFDLDATPDFAARLAGSGLQWPPASPINFPLKHW